jgi:hypothetical protein
MFRYKLRTLPIVLALLLPSLAWGRSERHDYRERARLRQGVKRVVQENGKPKPDRPWPYFKLDVF